MLNREFYEHSDVDWTDEMRRTRPERSKLEFLRVKERALLPPWLLAVERKNRRVSERKNSIVCYSRESLRYQGSRWIVKR